MRCGNAFKKYSYLDVLKNLFLRQFSTRDAIASIRDRHKTIELKQKVLSLEKKCIGSKGEKCLTLSQYPGKIFKSSWFREPVPLKFEDTIIMVPSDYDNYLKILYGDYMKLPPVELRNGHSLAYYNLHQRLTLGEVLQKIK